MNDYISLANKYGVQAALSLGVLFLLGVFATEFIKGLANIVLNWTFQGEKMKINLLGIAWSVNILGFIILAVITVSSRGIVSANVPQTETVMSASNRITSPVRQFSREQKDDLRNAITSIKQISGSEGTALVNILDRLPTDFDLAIAPYMGGDMIAPAEVSDIIKKLTALSDDCAALQQKLFEDSKSPSKLNIAYSADIKKILDPDVVIPLLSSIKTQADNIRQPGLTAFSVRNKGFQKIYNSIEKIQSQESNIPTPSQLSTIDQYRKTESATNNAMYELIKQKVETLSAAKTELNGWIKKVEERSDKLLAEVDGSK